MSSPADAPTSRAADAVERLRSLLGLPPVHRAVFSMSVGLLAVAIGRMGLGVAVHLALAAVALAVVGATLWHATRVRLWGMRTASGAIGREIPRRSPKQVVAGVLPYLLLWGVLAMVDDVAAFLEPIAVSLAFGLVMAVVTFVCIGAFLGDEGPPSPPRSTNDPRLTDPDAAALVAILDHDADVRADVAARALDVDPNRLVEILRPLHAEGLVRMWTRERRVVHDLGDAPADPGERWIGLTGAGRQLF